MYGVIDTVQVVSQRVRHANEANAGAKVSRIDPEIMRANKTRSLAELLTDYTAIYIKSLGMGALSTASFRGASPSQTRVNWNGLILPHRCRERLIFRRYRCSSRIMSTCITGVVT